MPYTQGTQQSTVIGFESSFKVLGGSPAGEKVPTVGMPTMRQSRNKFKSQSLTGSPESRPVVFGKSRYDGELPLECNAASLMPALKGLFGTPRSQGVGTIKSHEYYLQAPMLSMFIERRYADIAQFLLSQGVYLGATTLSFGQEGNMEARFGYKAAKHTDAVATQITGTITDRTGYDPFEYSLVRVRRAGATVAYSKSFAFTLDRRLGEDFAQDEQPDPVVIFSQSAEITCDWAQHFQDVVLHDLAEAGTETSMDIWNPGPSGHGLFVEFATLKFSPAMQETAGTGLSSQSIQGDIYGKVGVSKYPGRAYSDYWTTATLPALNTLTLSIKVDGGGSQVVTFTASETTVDAVVTKINADTTGCTVRAVRKAGDAGGIILIESDTKGTGSSIQVEVASTADVTLGYDNAVHAGLDGPSTLITIHSPLAA